MGIYVPDASVILKWAIGLETESHHEKAIHILDAWVDNKIEIVLPELWVFEVGNFLGRMVQDLALEKMETLLDFHFKTRKLDKGTCKLIFKLMNDLSVSFYDASYHALAQKMGGIFITADKKYYQKAKIKGGIELLENIMIHADDS